MKKANIREYMMRKIAESFEGAISEAEERIAEEIDEDEIYDFLWNKSFGQEIFENYIEESMDDLKEELLDDIYEDIDIEDILGITGRR